MSFTDQKSRKATEEDLSAPWSGGENGKYFRCYLCGHRFVMGDVWRWVYGKKMSNFLVCESCDGEDVIDRWQEMHDIAMNKFWWFTKWRCEDQ